MHYNILCLKTNRKEKRYGDQLYQGVGVGTLFPLVNEGRTRFSDFFDEDALYRWEFKNKGYAHFDTEFCQSRLNALLTTIEKDKPINHTCYPLIRFTIPKYKRDENGHPYIDKDKPRYIMHTARIDTNLYSFYRNLLMNQYEKTLQKLKIVESVIAYRKIPISPNNTKGKCNVHFANEAIEEIKKQTQEVEQCSAIAMDISGFFDNLDHGVIKRQWCRVMEFKNGLSTDHFTIFKNITRFRYIEAEELERKLHFKFGTLEKKQICPPNIFREKALPLQSKENKIGIPQGTTISDVIANMYMLDFDTWMKKFADKYKGYYRRYSDDILLICPTAFQNKIIKFVSWLINRTGKTLSISDKKTLISNFRKTETGIECTSYKNNKGKLETINKPFEYLGISFDGTYKRIRQSTISAFHIKLSERIKKEVNAAHLKLIREGNPFPNEDEVYKIIRFDKIRNSYMENRENDEKFRGNFYTYIQLIARVTGNKNVLDMFNDLGTKIKKKAKEYCKIRIRKHYDKTLSRKC